MALVNLDFGTLLYSSIAFDEDTATWMEIDSDSSISSDLDTSWHLNKQKDSYRSTLVNEGEKKDYVQVNILQNLETKTSLITHGDNFGIFNDSSIVEESIEEVFEEIKDEDKESLKGVSLRSDFINHMKPSCDICAE